MRRRLDRRTALTGLGALAFGATVAACGQPRQAEEPAPPPLDLTDLEARHGGRLGVSALDTAFNRSASWRGQERFAYCSTFKLFLAAATLERAARGEERLDRAIRVTRADIIPHAPVTGPAVGRALTVEALCRAMVEVSDNPAANILIREMGGLAAWRAWWPTLGDNSTTISRLEPDLNSGEANDPRDTALPDQTVGNLREVLLGDRLSPEHRRLLEGWMLASPTGPGRIKAAAPLGWAVAHKTGTGGNGATNDIGLLRPPSGQPVLVAAYFIGAAQATTEQREAILAEGVRRALRTLGHG